MKNINFKIQENVGIIEFDQIDSKVNPALSGNDLERKRKSGVNVLSTSLMQELKGIISELKNMSNLKGILITSAKPGIFIAGADIKEIEGISQAKLGIQKSKAGQEILNDLESISAPTVALINGACLGGGFELALACDYRLTTFSGKVKIGLPEVNLGIIPGFGGTKRLPQLVGLRKGLELIVGAKILSSQEAFKIGVVDKVVPEQNLFEGGLNFLEEIKGKKRIKKPKLKGWLNLFLDNTFLGRQVLTAQAKKFTLKAAKGFYPAPLKAIEAVLHNYTSSLNDALTKEAEVFGELAITDISKNLIKVFYLTEKYKKQKWVEALPREIHKVGVLGAGVMGGGIAQLISFHNIAVRLKDLNYNALGQGLKAAKKVFDYTLQKRKIKKHQVDFQMALISPTINYSGFTNVDLVIEAVVENMQVKKSVFAEMSKVVKTDTVLASNTSALSIDEMAQDIINPARVVGMHFFNPVHKMPLIEVIKGRRTSDEAVATIVDFSKRLGKTPIVVQDSCGFLINRILVPYLNEAGYMLEEGADFVEVDKIVTKFGMPMGPFTLLDEIGLDIGYKVAKILENGFGKRMKVCSILEKIYKQEWFGKKVSEGFYIYKGKKITPNREIYNLADPNKKTILSVNDILMRLVCIMINEAAMCLEEGICSEASDVDIGMIMGTGFPPFRAGLLNYADSIGIDKIVDKLKEFQERFNELRFKPSQYLINLAENKKKFYA